MKKVIIQFSVILFFITFMLTTAKTQDDLNKTYSWNDKTEEVTLTVTVEPGTKELAMLFNGKVSKGNLVVTALDPSGNGECGFCLITDCSLSCGKARDKTKGDKNAARRKGMSSSSSSNTNDGVTKMTMSCSGKGYSYTNNNSQGDFGARGNSNETISNPTPGEWTFVIEAIKVTGDLEVSIEQD